jgi:beta-N-acetylhexosaminidase
MKSFKITALSLVLVLLLAACGAKNDTPDEPAVDPTPEPPIEQPVEKTPDERINDIIAGMSIEEKVGQLFFVRCPETGAAEDVSAYHLGGLLLFGRDYKDANGDWLTEDDFTAALASYQDAAAIPLFIGSDEEGGTVRIPKAAIRISFPRCSPPRRSFTPRADSTGCSNERSATTRSSKRSAST